MMVMADGDLARQARRMPEQIDGRAVFARNITNKDLALKDEMDDEIAELQLLHAKLVGRDIRTDGGEIVHAPGEVDECPDAERRREIRAEARKIAAKIRDHESLLMKLYIEDENGTPFAEEVLAATPVRLLNRLAEPATKYAFGVEDEKRPTTASSGSG